MTVERSKRRSLLALTFIAKSTSKNLLIRILLTALVICVALKRIRRDVSLDYFEDL